MIAVVIGFMTALALIYMLRPRFKAFVVSAAAFFEQTTTEKPPRVVLRLDAALLSRSFWTQLLALFCLLLALIFSQHGIEQPATQSVGVWLVVDTSASMSTLDGSGTRMDAARAEIDVVIEALAALPTEVSVCATLAVFDMNVTRLPDAAFDTIRSAATALTPRPLGTDLTLPRRLIAQLTSRSDLDCPLTHLVVISDATPPGWVTEPRDDVQVLWRVVGQPADNVGITNVVYSGGGVLGWQGEIHAELAAYGAVPRETTVTVRRNADGVVIETKTVEWFQDRESVAFTLTGMGTYTIELEDGGAYAYDDSAVIAVPDAEQRRVDWQLPDTAIMAELGWVQDAQTPELRVVSIANPQIDQTPTLIVGDQYGRTIEARNIGYFEEGSPLLDNLNLDVAEQLGIEGVQPFGAELGVQNVLVERGSNAVWVATNENPRFAFIPGLPDDTGDENTTAFTKTLFYNAVRWLLQTRQLPPLYTLTSSAQPTIEGTRIALHPSEGDTAQAATPVGTLSAVAPLVAGTHENPIWVWFVLAAALLVLLEHVLAVFGGRKWGT